MGADLFSKLGLGQTAQQAQPGNLVSEFQFFRGGHEFRIFSFSQIPNLRM